MKFFIIIFMFFNRLVLFESRDKLVIYHLSEASVVSFICYDDV